MVKRLRDVVLPPGQRAQWLTLADGSVVPSMTQLHVMAREQGYANYFDAPDRLRSDIMQRWKDLMPPAAPQSAAPVCATCEGRGQVYYNVPPDHDWYKKLMPCPHCEDGQELAARIYNARLKDARLPPHYTSLTFETFAAMPVDLLHGKNLAYCASLLFVQSRNYSFPLSQAYALASEPYPLGDYDPARNGVALYGSFGAGKTGLAASVINYLIAAGKTSLYIRVQDLITSIQSSYARDHEGESAETLIHLVRSAPVLVLDEFTIRQTDNRAEILESIVRYRHGHNLPMFLTTNASPTEVTSVWGGRIADVLKESCHWVAMGGVNLRAKYQIGDEE